MADIAGPLSTSCTTARRDRMVAAVRVRQAERTAATWRGSARGRDRTGPQGIVDVLPLATDALGEYLSPVGVGTVHLRMVFRGIDHVIAGCLQVNQLGAM